MKPLEALDPRSILGLLTDLDDTVTDESMIHPEAFDGLWNLKKAGLRVAIVSGRPAGWADCLVRLWPIDAMIFENGAGFVYKEGSTIRRAWIASSEERARAQALMDLALSKIQEEIPAAKLASDQHFRLFDYAVDFAEEPPFLSTHQVDRVLEILKSFPEITAKLSSIHVNFWKGSHTKLDACHKLLREHWKLSSDQVVYCGDSPNDEPLFEHFAHSIGVANVSDFLDKMSHLPAYITRSRGGSGFREICLRLLTRT